MYKRQIGNSVGDFSPLCTGTEDVVVLAVLKNSGSEPQSGFEISYQLNDGNTVTETYDDTLMPDEEVTYSFEQILTISEPEEYTLSMTVNAANDENDFNNSASLDFFSAVASIAINFDEDFEGNPGNTLPDGWSVINDDESFTWEGFDGIVGSDNNTTSAAFVNHFIYTNHDAEDFLLTEFYDLTSLSEAFLTFDLAKAQFSPSFIDDLRVDISTDCGGSYTEIYFKTGLDLSTLPNYDTTFIWEPTSSEHWRTEEIDLQAYIGNHVQFRFVSVNGNGSSTFIDNVNVNDLILNIENAVVSSVKLYPNPASEKVIIDFATSIAADASIVIVNGLGQTVQTLSKTSREATMIVDVSKYSSGLYFVTITSNGTSKTEKLIIY